MLKFSKLVAVNDICGEQKDVITKTSNFNECAAHRIMGWLSDSEKRKRGMVVFSEW